MGEETRMTMSEYEGGGSGGDGDDERVSEWELGLPSADDLTPLSQPLIPIELASAFSISPEPPRTAVDVNRASQKTVSTLRGSQPRQSYSSNYKPFDDDDDEVVELDDGGEGEGSVSRKSRKVDSPEEADSALRIDGEDPGSGSGPGRVSGGSSAKRPRLVWTPQLHKRFVDVVGHLGIKNAVPKTIMQLMNVEGLTRENVASHLQKYRLYLKRMQGLSPNEGPSSASDQLFASTPVPKSLHESGGGARSGAHQNGNGQHQQRHMPISIPMPYPPPMMPMPMYGHMGMSGPAGGFHGFESHPSYSMMQQHKYGSMVSYPHNVAPNEK